MKKWIRFLAGLGLLLLASCGYDPQPIAAVPEAKGFWQVFIEANESGSREQFLNCFQQPHSEKIEKHATLAAIQIRFVKALMERFREAGIKEFNDHRIIGGKVYSWPPILSSSQPKVVSRSASSFTLDDYGWILEVVKDEDGTYRISNADEAFNDSLVSRYSKEVAAYEYGLERLKNGFFRRICVENRHEQAGFRRLLAPVKRADGIKVGAVWPCLFCRGFISPARLTGAACRASGQTGVLRAKPA